MAQRSSYGGGSSETETDTGLLLYGGRGLPVPASLNVPLKGVKVEPNRGGLVRGGDLRTAGDEARTAGDEVRAGGDNTRFGGEETRAGGARRSLTGDGGSGSSSSELEDVSE